MYLRNFFRVKTYKNYSYIISKQFCNQYSTKSHIKPVKLVYADYNNNSSTESPLLVLHGLFGSKSNWQSICISLERKLSPSRRIIAVDLRNHGASEHSDIHTYEALSIDVKQLLQQLNINKVCFLAHSMGGRTAMFFSLVFPELVQNLIVVDISPVSNSPDLSSTFKYFKAMREAPIVNGSLSAARTTVDKYLRPTVKNKTVRAFLLTNLVEINGEIKWRINLVALENNYKNIATFSIAPESGKTFAGPVTFIRGATSDHMNDNDNETIKKLFPAAIVETIKDAGHWAHFDQPIKFQDIVIRSLK